MRRTATAVLAFVLFGCGSDPTAPAAGDVASDVGGETPLAGTEATEVDPPASAEPGQLAEERSSTEIAAPAPTEVTLQDEGGFRFSPGEVTVAVGDTVRWTHQGVASHTVSGGGLNSGPMQGGGTYEAVFDETGTFDYLCYFHPDMRGTVTVTP